MPTLTSGNTLSLNNLAGATGNTQNSNVSLGTIKGSPQASDNIGLSTFAVDSVGSVTGFTYLVESTSDTYDLTFSGDGANFSKVKAHSGNFTWGVTGAGFITVSGTPTSTATLAASAMNPQSPGTQTTLLSQQTHTVSATFADGYNDHIGSGNGYNVARTKPVYSIDTYDGNTALCLTSDSPVIKSDGTIVEAGELEEGDKLQGYSLSGLSNDSDGDFFDWSASELGATEKEVTVVSVVYSFTQRYYTINDGEITATGEHPLLVKDIVTGLYKFKQILTIEEGDFLIKKGNAGIEEIEVVSKVAVNETTEIVSIDVEEQDTYLVNGYITHNKGTSGAHSDLVASSAPTSLAYSSPSLSWSAPASSGTTGITGYDFQIDDNSDFSSPIANVTEWSSTTVEVLVGYSLSPGTTYYARVRAIDHGLKSNYTATLTFTA
jgi:hypothetical protein